MKPHQVQRLLIASITMLAASPAYGQVYKCDGKWTNKPCEGAAEETLEERPARTRNPEDPDRNEKRSIMHNVSTLAYEIRKTYGVRTQEDSALEAYCMQATTSTQDCKARAEESETKLRELERQSHASETEKKQPETQKEDDTIEGEGGLPDQDQHQVDDSQDHFGVDEQQTDLEGWTGEDPNLVEGDEPQPVPEE